MKATERREAIIKLLHTQIQPISASALASQYGVSRQLIVGDIALLRAEGHEIIATSKGYITSPSWQAEHHPYQQAIVCKHSEKETRQELELIVSLGGEIVDVSIEHPIYGTLVGRLDISSQEDIDAYLKLLTNSKTTLLSSLTDGIHMHTIACQDQAHLMRIKNALSKAKLLYDEVL